MRYGYFDEEKKEYVITRPDLRNTELSFPIIQGDTALQNPGRTAES